MPVAIGIIDFSMNESFAIFMQVMSQIMQTGPALSKSNLLQRLSLLQRLVKRSKSQPLGESICAAKFLEI